MLIYLILCINCLCISNLLPTYMVGKSFVFFTYLERKEQFNNLKCNISSFYLTLTSILHFYLYRYSHPFSSNAAKLLDGKYERPCFVANIRQQIRRSRCSSYTDQSQRSFWPLSTGAHQNLTKLSKEFFHHSCVMCHIRVFLST